jgi:putative ABC transport system permease protein
LACVFFTLLLVAGNTMAQAVRERIAELAVLKTIGFSDGQVMWTVLAESLIISFIGGGLGLALGTLFVEGASTQLAQFLPGLSVNARILLTGAGLAMLLGLVAGAVPAWQARRMRVVDALAEI